MRYDLTPENDERIHLTRQPVEMEEEPAQEMEQVWEEPAIVQPPPRPVKKGLNAEMLPEVKAVCHSIFTVLLLGIGGAGVVVGLFLLRESDARGASFVSAGFAMVTVALVLRGIERCARALEKLAGE